MTNSKGYRRSTRTLFAREFRQHGYIPLSKVLTVYKKGDLVSIKTNGAIQKGMPHKSYHGKTGYVYNVTKRGLGVIVNKRVRGRIIPKKINVRMEHVIKNKSREEFLKRVHKNDELRKEAREKGAKPENCDREACAEQQCCKPKQTSGDACSIKPKEQTPDACCVRPKEQTDACCKRPTAKASN